MTITATEKMPEALLADYGSPLAQQQQTTLQKIANFSVEFGPGKKDILDFTNQLSIMVRAGISLPEAMESIVAQLENKKFKAIITDIKNRIEAGESFSQALSRHRKVFKDIYVNMIAASEMSGSLSSMLQKLSSYIGQEMQTRSQVIGAMVYPGIIAFMAVSCTTFLLTFVLPKFTELFVGKEHMLPKPTVIIMALSSFLITYWLAIIIGIAAIITGLVFAIKTVTGRFWWDKTKLFLPLMKTLCKCLYITRGLHAMGVLINAGVPILDALNITAEVSGNVHYKNMWVGVHESVRQGKKIAQSFKKDSLLPASVIQMIRSGEDSGTLGSVLEEVSDFYQGKLKDTIKIVTSMIEPLMIVLMGMLVGFIAMAIILPIFKMSSMASGH
ncbi:MAG: type II secretion system F family protein [Anaerohalosphaeraceae bacterium]|nr:type II secretion system F family protein [Anaerohalosphaeraceae bacterium]